MVRELSRSHFPNKMQAAMNYFSVYYACLDTIELATHQTLNSRQPNLTIYMLLIFLPPYFYKIHGFGGEEVRVNYILFPKEKAICLLGYIVLPLQKPL